MRTERKGIPQTDHLGQDLGLTVENVPGLFGRYTMPEPILFNLHEIEFVTANVRTADRSYTVIARPNSGVMIVNNDSQTTWRGARIVMNPDTGYLALWQYGGSRPILMIPGIRKVTVVEN